MDPTTTDTVTRYDITAIEGINKTSDGKHKQKYFRPLQFAC